MYPARRERRKKDISTWSMVIPFHSQQFTVKEIDRGEWWCSRCDKRRLAKCEPDDGDFSLKQSCQTMSWIPIIRFGRICSPSRLAPAIRKDEPIWIFRCA